MVQLTLCIGRPHKVALGEQGLEQRCANGGQPSSWRAKHRCSCLVKQSSKIILPKRVAKFMLPTLEQPFQMSVERATPYLHSDYKIIYFIKGTGRDQTIKKQK